MVSDPLTWKSYEMYYQQEEGPWLYKLADFFIQKLAQVISLQYAFNVNNTLQLIQDLEESSIDSNTRLASSDIIYIYIYQ